MAAKKDDRDDEKETTKSRATKDVAPAATTIVGLPADDYKTAQELGAPDPQNEPVEPEKAVVLDIPKNQPYPTGGV